VRDARIGNDGPPFRIEDVGFLAGHPIDQFFRSVQIFRAFDDRARLDVPAQSFFREH
jgi:hypothetical protein